MEHWWNYTGKGNVSTLRYPVPLPLCSPQIPYRHGTEPWPPRWEPATDRLSHDTVFRRFSQNANSNISFVMSVCLSARPSVRPHEMLLPLGGFS
jgi:hypothetical protein